MRPEPLELSDDDQATRHPRGQRAEVRASSRGEQAEALDAPLKALDAVSRPFAERIMSAAWRQVRAGRSVEDF